MSPMEQLAKQEYERGYSDGKSDYFAAGVAEGEMRARQRMIANRVVANQHPFAASGKPIDHIPDATKMVAPEGYALISIEALKAWGKYDEVRSACRFPAEPMNRPQNCGTGYCSCIECPYEPVKQEPVALDEVRRIAAEYAEPNSQVDSGNLYWALCEALKYTAPVDAKAIRAEALEDAVKFLEENGMIAPNGFTADGIRGLK